jgi:hypothetical protein
VSTEIFYVAMADYGGGFAAYGGQTDLGRTVYATRDIHEAIRDKSIVGLTRKLAGHLKQFRPVCVTLSVELSPTQNKWASLEEAFSEG